MTVKVSERTRAGLNPRGTARRCHCCRQLLRHLTTAIPKAKQQNQGKHSQNPLWAMDKSFPATRAQYWAGKETQPATLQPPTHFICRVQLSTGYCIFNCRTGREDTEMLLLHPVASPSGFTIIQQGREDLVGLGLPGSSSLDLDAASQGGARDHILSRAWLNGRQRVCKERKSWESTI